MRKPILIGAFLACIIVLTIAGTKISRLTETTTLPDAGGSIFVVVTGSTDKATRFIQDTNLITELSQLPNWVAPVSAQHIKTNGVSVTTTATSLDFVTGSNTVVKATNVAGVVTVQINTGPSSANISTNENQFGASVQLTLKDGVLTTNQVQHGITTNAGSAYKIRGNSNPEFEITSITLPQTFFANSQGIGTRSGGGQPYLLFSPEGTPTIEIPTDSIRPVNGALVDVGTQGRPFQNGYFNHWVSSSNFFLGSPTTAAVKLLHGSASPEGVYAAPPQSLFFQTNQTSGIGLWLKTNGYGSSGWWLVAGGGGGGLSDGDKGDVTVSASASYWEVDPQAITLSKLTNASTTQRFLGRNTSGAGSFEEVSLTQALDWIGSAAQGDILYRGAATWARLPAGTSGQLLQTPGPGGNPLWATVGTLTDGNKGHITLSGVATVWQINPGVPLTNAYLGNLPTNSVAVVSMAGYLTNATKRVYLETNQSPAAISNIIAGLSYGDLAEFGVGRFNFGVTTIDPPPGVRIAGQGIGVTALVGGGFLFTNGPLVSVSSSNIIEDLDLIKDADHISPAAAIGFNYTRSGGAGNPESAATNVVIRRVRALGWNTDTFYFSHTNYHSGKVVDCEGFSQTDNLVVSGGGTHSGQTNWWEFYNCKFLTDQSGAPSGLQGNAVAIRATVANISLFNCIGIATNGGSSYAVRGTGTNSSRIRIYGGHYDAAGTNASPKFDTALSTFDPTNAVIYVFNAPVLSSEASDTSSIVHRNSEATNAFIHGMAGIGSLFVTNGTLLTSLTNSGPSLLANVTNTGRFHQQGPAVFSAVVTNGDQTYFNERINQQPGNFAQFGNLRADRFQYLTNAAYFQYGMMQAWTNIAQETNMTLVLTNAPHFITAQPSNTTWHISFANSPAAGSPADRWIFTLYNTNSAAITCFWPSTIDTRGSTPVLLSGPSTNIYEIIWTGTNIYVASYQELTTGTGPFVLQTNATIVTPSVTWNPGIFSNIVASGFATPYIGITTNSGTFVNTTGLVARTPSLVISNDAGGLQSIHVNRSGLYRTIYVDAAAMISNVTAGATFSTEESQGTMFTTNKMIDSYIFDGAASNCVQFKLAMPLEWDLSTVKVKLWTWSTNNVATTTNVWGVQALAIKDTTVITNQTWGTEQTITNAVSSDGGAAHLTAATPSLTVGNTPASGGNLVLWRVRRIPQNANDNDSGQQKLLGAWIQYKEKESEVASW